MDPLAKKKDDDKAGHKRHDSNSSRGSIGRKERLRNALTGRSDGSDGGADQPVELPDDELCDFMKLYDENDPFSCKIIVKKEKITKEESSKSSDGEKEEEVKDQINEQGDFEGGSIGSGPDG